MNALNSSETIADLLRMAWTAGATDLLLVDGRPPMIRREGTLAPMPGALSVVGGTEILRLLEPCVGAERLDQFKAEQEIDFGFSIDGVARIRGNLFLQRGTPAVAFRLVPTTSPTMDSLGLPLAVQALASRSQGLVLFTGPTGSGKSTSLASLINWINQHRRCHIITIEDPIEYVHDHDQSIVSQREIGVDTNSFPRALRAALREDPDVILVGEMRDAESIAIALTLAETGHLVFSTLHTNDTAQAVDRIVDVFPGDRQDQIRIQLAGSLSAVIAQRLLRRTGGGQIAAYEVLMGTSAVHNLVREGKTRQIRNAIVTGGQDGMQTLESSLSNLVARGDITYEDALACAIIPAEVMA